MSFSVLPRWILVGVLQRSFVWKSRISSHLLCLLFCVIWLGNCSWLTDCNHNKHMNNTWQCTSWAKKNGKNAYSHSLKSIFQTCNLFKVSYKRTTSTACIFFSALINSRLFEWSVFKNPLNRWNSDWWISKYFDHTVFCFPLAKPFFPTEKQRLEEQKTEPLQQLYVVNTRGTQRE